jgi:hypothetical protein
MRRRVAESDASSKMFVRLVVVTRLPSWDDAVGALSRERRRTWWVYVALGLRRAGSTSRWVYVALGPIGFLALAIARRSGVPMLAPIVGWGWPVIWLPVAYVIGARALGRSERNDG